MSTASLFTRVALACGALAVAALAPLAAAADFPPYAKVLGIAVIAPLSGPEKQLGLDISAGVDAAVADANAQRGLTDFAWVTHSFDDQADPGIAQQQAQFALVDPGTAFIIGHLGGQETLLAESVYHEQEVPLIIPTASLARLTQQGYDNVFRVCPPDTVEGQFDARYAERTLKATKVAVVWQQDDVGANTATGFMNYAAGGKLKAQDFPVDLDLKHVADVVAKVQAYAPDWLFLTGNGADMGKVLKALRKADVTTPVLGSSSLHSDAVAKALGADGNDLLVSSCVPPVNLMPTAQVFTRRYQAQHGRLSSYALYGYVAAQIAISAAEQAGSADKRTLIRKLSTGQFETVVGPIGFRTGGDVSDPNVYFYRYDAKAGFKYAGSVYPNPLILR
ncbi:MAG: branched-chain amino acid ABC transporter substrate-binding protein [Candidatus Eremiobacteraeota bacterium]|nr:branched-chain amino acid ABC transporter substrate-binding protein [Candidatus Eremiobacteraeota bacterium]